MRGTQPLGRPAAVLLCVALCAGAFVALRPAQPRADQIVWTFAKTHADSLRDGDPSPLDVYEQRTGRGVDVKLMDGRAMDLRLTSMLRGGDAADLPDVVQIESLSAAKFLDAGDGQIGLMPLDERLDAESLRDQMLPARLALWQRHGRTYGLPVDVHAVALAYRRDLFEEAGVDPAACQTWPELADALRRYCDYWHAHGKPYAVGLELARSRSDHLTLMLQQRGVSLIDESGRPTLSDSKLADTLAFYAGLVAGSSPVAGPTSDGHERWARDLAAGDVAMLWMPDWRLKYLELAAPELAGKLALMPLPIFDAGDAPTAAWGGAMLAIPRGAADPDAAWQLLKFLAFSDESLAGRRRGTHILPPLPAAWSRPEYQENSDYFGARVEAFYATLAPLERPEPATPLRVAAYAHLAALASRSAGHLDAGHLDAGHSLEELRRALPSWLADAEADLRRRRAFLQDAADE